MALHPNHPVTRFARPQGADPQPQGGVRYRIWAPATPAVEVVFFGQDGEKARTFALKNEGNGFFSGIDAEGGAGDRYKFRLGEQGEFPDPFSRWQPDDVFAPSMVIDPAAFTWKVDAWEKVALADAVIYELHLGTFSPEGTFRGAIERLEHLVDLGVTTIEIMPVAAFPGQRNWGYDGVMLFAPDSSYGHPDDFRALVDAAHERGLNVILDVVYNHFGPDGNFLALYSPHYFDPEKKTPWGDAINFSGDGAQHVRAIFLANVAYWMDEFRIDGFRLDATHEILDDSGSHILGEIAALAQSKGGIVVAEDGRNLARLAHPRAKGGDGLDGLWADDLHHNVRVALLRQQESYFRNFSGTAEELVQTLHHGWLYCGQALPSDGTRRGTPTGGLGIHQFIHCISNHDQVGNRAFGERLNHLCSPEGYRAASALLCLTPSVPMFFMGQEWGASTPFLYFTDHHAELGKLVTEGRRREFKEFFEALHESRPVEQIPDPQAESTFSNSKLRWEETGQKKHTEILTLYRALLQIRRSNPDLRRRTRDNFSVKTAEEGIVSILFKDTKHSGLLVLVTLTGGGSCRLQEQFGGSLASGWTWKPILSSNEPRFGGARPLEDHAGEVISLPDPEVLLLQSSQAS
jgi:maltooligosyltrehalose trehalohydrolase